MGRWGDGEMGRWGDGAKTVRAQPERPGFQTRRLGDCTLLSETELRSSPVTLKVVSFNGKFCLTPAVA